LAPGIIPTAVDFGLTVVGKRDCAPEPVLKERSVRRTLLWARSHAALELKKA
jgi:hypothetical protein